MKKLLICDLDNTLYNWVEYFVPSFYAMVDEVVRITGCDREVLLDDFRTVHQKYHDTEHPFSLLETATIGSLYPGKSRSDLAKILDSALHAFNSTRKRTLVLYPTVRQAIEDLKSLDVRIIAHTEGKVYSVMDRLDKLNLLNFFSSIYCRERSDSPHVSAETGQRWLGRFPMERVFELKSHQRKPNADVLLEICRRERVSPLDSVYVGDSLSRDILMANLAGVFTAWAKYGTEIDRSTYEALVRISHWTKEDVDRELDLKEQAKNAAPNVTLEFEFEEILDKGFSERTLSGRMLSRDQSRWSPIDG
ncbi:MAG: HAD hydrolase-like protein [Rhodobacteraceae bacterium]|nr:HAD hydrolase-like protein [Paracoccaceae bacterium]